MSTLPRNCLLNRIVSVCLRDFHTKKGFNELDLKAWCFLCVYVCMLRIMSWHMNGIYGWILLRKKYEWWLNEADEFKIMLAATFETFLGFVLWVFRQLTLKVQGKFINIGWERVNINKMKYAVTLNSLTNVFLTYSMPQQSQFFIENEGKKRRKLCSFQLPFHW